MGVHITTSISSENGYLAPFEKLFFSKYYVSVHKFFFKVQFGIRMKKQ